MAAPFPLFFIAILAISILSWVVGRRMDRERITDFLQERGAQAQTIERLWFGPGWYGDKNRIYQVEYLDANGRIRHATCKTRALSGVYWTDGEDDPLDLAAARFQGEGPSAQELAALRQENARLRRELERRR